MYYIYGSRKDRERFIKSGTFPFFESMEELDANCARYYNDSEDDGRSAWLVIDLDEQTYTVLDVNEAGETLGESEFDNYSDAVDAYDKLNEAIEAQTVKTMATKRDMFKALTSHVSQAEFFYGYKINGRTKEQWETALNMYWKDLAEAIKRGYARGASGRKITGADNIMRVVELNAINRL